MKYCPECGTKLHSLTIENKQVSKCDNCGFIDWNSWVFVACCVVAYDKEDRVLLVRLKQNGKLTFPGGFRDLGETLIDAAKREFYEETGGMIVDDLELYKTYTKDELRLIWVVFKGKIAGGSFKENDEAFEMMMVSKEDEIDSTEFRGNLTSNLFKELSKENKD